MSLWKALWQSAKDLFEPKILFFLILSPVLSLTLWGLVFFFFAMDWVANITLWLNTSDFFNWITGLLGVTDLGLIPKVLAIIVVILLFLPLTYFTTVMVISIFGMPVIVKVLSEKYYPNLPKVAASGIGALWNTLSHSLIFLFLFLVTLPLWLIPGFQIFVPILLAAAYNRRIFSYDALGDFLTHEEIKLFQKKHRSDLLLLGVFVSGLAYLPLASFIMPIMGAIAYTHFCLAQLKKSMTISL